MTVTFRAIQARFIQCDEALKDKLTMRMTMIVRILIGAVVGGGIGFAYHKFVGCSTGACPLTKNPVISSLYGMVVGALFASSFK